MSWAAHELEAYVIQRHAATHISFLAVLLGSLISDMFTKLPVYGVEVGHSTFLKAADAAQYHRGWPGAGFSTSLFFGVMCFALVLVLFKHRGWALGVMIGVFAHTLTDSFDSAGAMLFFPFTTQVYGLGMWAYAGQEGRHGDAIAYYSSLGGAWDLLWLVLAALAWRVFTRDYFHEVVVPRDPAWGWLRRRLRLSDVALRALYRAYFFYGACRIFAWGIWAHAVKGAPFDLSWGGPYWVTPGDISFEPAGEMLVNTGVGVAGLTLACLVLWRLWLRRHWHGATDAPAPVPALA